MVTREKDRGKFMMWQEMIGSGSLRSMRADKLPSGAVRQVLQESGGSGAKSNHRQGEGGKETAVNPTG